MKKFFSAFLTAILLVFPISLSACSNDGEWKEIQSIYYRTDGGGNTVTSTYWYECQRVEVTQEEYESASSELIGSRYEGGKIRTDRKTHINKLSSVIGEYYYFSYPIYEDTKTVLEYFKYTYTSLEVRYVEIKFLDDSSFELKYYENGDYVTIRVLPTSYVITYFTE